MRAKRRITLCGYMVLLRALAAPVILESLEDTPFPNSCVEIVLRRVSNAFEVQQRKSIIFLGYSYPNSSFNEINVSDRRGQSCR